MLGMRGGKIIADRLYYHLVEMASRPTLIMTGSRPLFPAQSKLPPVVNVPSVVDDVDRAFIAKIGNPFVSVSRVAGAGHLCLDAANPAAVQIVTQFCRKYLPTPNAAADADLPSARGTSERIDPREAL
jgi:hypothetical protein